MTTFPTRLEDLAGKVPRAGGTDLMERQHKGLWSPPVADLRDLPEMDRIEVLSDGGITIGAKVTLARVAEHGLLRAAWSGVTKAAGGLATPEIRATGTIGGNLAQHTRCWYYRNPAFDCLKRAGIICSARDGDHVWHAAFDRSACVSVHASTMACALLTYDVMLEVASAPGTPPPANAVVDPSGLAWSVRTLPDVLGDGHDARKHNALAPGEVIAKVHLPPPTKGDKTAYFRAISRSAAEWPLVEASVRLTPGGARVAVGAVAGVPLRLPQVEAALDAGESFEKAVSRAADGAMPLRGTGYKLALLPAVIRTALEMAS